MGKIYQCFFVSQTAMFTSLSDSVTFWTWFIVKQYLLLLPTTAVNTKDSAFSSFKTAHRKYTSPNPLWCLSLSAKGQHWNFVIYFFHSLSSFTEKHYHGFLWSTCIEWEIVCTLVFSVPTVASLQRRVSLTESTQLVSAALHAHKSSSFTCGKVRFGAAVADRMSCSVFYSFLHAR